jgi:UDP-N-acetylglucosamine transferase subunit ALG13
VRRAVVAFASTLPAFRGKGVVLGNPVREEFYALPPKRRTGTLDVLVFGGSQGSRFLNGRVTAALPLLAAAKGRLRFAHQTGPADLERVRAAYRAAGFDNAEVAAYFPGMAAYFGRADLVVCRAGATTLAELIAARKAALLVPFAGAADDHQTANARELGAAGGAVVLAEAESHARGPGRSHPRLSRPPGGARRDGAQRRPPPGRGPGRPDRGPLPLADEAPAQGDRRVTKKGYRKLNHIHMVGIGGTGMNGIAEVLLNLGYKVSGSDLQENDATRRLERLGAEIAVGHRAENLKNADVVVISSAVREDNVEVQKARTSLIPVIPGPRCWPSSCG